jgi:hypothetical protein
VLVFGVPMLEGALAPFLPAAFRPDLALLVVFRSPLSWRDHRDGLVLAALCGFVVDLFSGALLGQHALLSVLAFVAARVLSVHVSMIGACRRWRPRPRSRPCTRSAWSGSPTFFTPGADFSLLRAGIICRASPSTRSPRRSSRASCRARRVGSRRGRRRRPLRHRHARSWVP